MSLHVQGQKAPLTLLIVPCMAISAEVSEPKIPVATCKLCMGVKWGPGSHHRDWCWGWGQDWEGALTAI